MKTSKIASRTEFKKSIRGQGMSEYMIIVGVIAAAAIGTFGLFGGTVEDQMSAMSTAMVGNVNVAADTSSQAQIEGVADEQNSLATFNQQ